MVAGSFACPSSWHAFFCRRLHVLFLMVAAAAVSSTCRDAVRVPFVMVVDYLFRVGHAAVTDLDAISVEDFSELVIFGKVLVY